MSAMEAQSFRSQVAAGRGGRGIVTLPFDPDQVWGARSEHRVGGTLNGSLVRGTLTRGEHGWMLIVTPMWMRDTGVAPGTDVDVELSLEGPHRADLAEDIRTALEANPAATAFFDQLAHFYRKGYLRWIDATRGRPEVRAARIAEVVDLLAAGIKQRRA